MNTIDKSLGRNPQDITLQGIPTVMRELPELARVFDRHPHIEAQVHGFEMQGTICARIAYALDSYKIVAAKKLHGAEQVAMIDEATRIATLLRDGHQSAAEVFAQAVGIRDRLTNLLDEMDYGNFPDLDESNDPEFGPNGKCYYNPYYGTNS